jgi:hypothetical protein
MGILGNAAFTISKLLTVSISCYGVCGSGMNCGGGGGVCGSGMNCGGGGGVCSSGMNCSGS